MRSHLIVIRISIAMLFISQSSFSQEKVKRYLLTSEEKTITSENNKTFNVESGLFYVPENREIDNGRTIAIAYYRIKSKSENPAIPIFLLAGGPGGSYINSLHKQELFNEANFYSNFADVIIFDQRGAGNSIPSLDCKGSVLIPLTETLSKNNIQKALRRLATDCKDFWEDKDVDLSAYNTDENASDINDLRKAFNYEKIMLVGGSYGSHLGLHIIRKFPHIVERALFHGIEGPDHTWDVPSDHLNVLKRISTRVESSEYFIGKIPKEGLIHVLKQIINDVEKNPKKVLLKKNNNTIEVIVDKMVVQAVAMYNAGKRNSPLDWPNLILDMYNGDFTVPAQAAVSMHSISAPNAMSNAMDFASGVSINRRIKIENDIASQILGNINYGYTMREGIWNEKDLGSSFRENVTTDIPILLIHGTWDTSTAIENAYDVLSTLKNGHLIEVIEGTHNALYELYEYDKSFPAMIVNFIKGNTSNFPDTLELPKIEFPERVTKEQEDLWDACIVGDFEKAKESIIKGADVNALDTRKSKSGRRPLNWASFYGHSKIVKLLLDNRAAIDAQNKSGFTAIHHAVENNQKDIVIQLIRAKADISIANKNGKKPKDTALMKKYSEIVSLLK
ncbi:alpha/beta fold hydrolase [uncultured Winogradskyella sp.]|uniref:alpha/beta fold hydrolase n=1 Tax=uncultured Winogradskyella sp. TaxID=395353 RepID=UPI002604F25E|nr:alpha/beta fold hydrolase [uncultured Winogradskyella sp.]